MTRLFSAAGAFVFAGLMTEGIRRHFEVKFVHNSEYGTSTHRLNHPAVPIYEPDDIRLDEPIDLLYAQPECAPWSQANRTRQQGQTRRNERGVNDMRFCNTNKTFELVDWYEPRFFMLESVQNAFKQGFEYYDEHATRLRKNGYYAHHLLIDGIRLGTPQTRKRYFFIATKKPLWLPELVEPGPWAWPLNVLKDVEPEGCDIILPSASKAIEKYGCDGMEPGIELRKWYTDVADVEYNKHGYVVGRPPFGDRRLPLEGFARPYVGYTWLHPTECRAITLNELKAMCGIPQEYKFVAKSALETMRLVARSVMPKTAEWMARAAKGTLEGRGGDMPAVIDLTRGETR